MAALTGSLMTAPSQLTGTQDGLGSPRMTALAASGINPIPHFLLSCFDSTNTRQHWVDTTPQFVTSSAPVIAPATYVTGTFVVISRF